MPTPDPVALETFLARLFADDELHARFLVDPSGTARAEGLGDAEADSVSQIDRAGLELARKSYARKRAMSHKPVSGWHRILASVTGLLRARDGGRGDVARREYRPKGPRSRTRS